MLLVVDGRDPLKRLFSSGKLLLVGSIKRLEPFYLVTCISFDAFPQTAVVNQTAIYLPILPSHIADYGKLELITLLQDCPALHIPNCFWRVFTGIWGLSRQVESGGQDYHIGPKKCASRLQPYLLDCLTTILPLEGTRSLE